MKRRTFLKTASTTGLAVAATPNLLLGAAKESPNEKLNMGIIGSGGRGSANLRGVASENIVATMFSEATPRRFAEPLPPEPMMPIFSFSLGDSFAAPSNKFGVAATARPVVLAVLRKVLRFILIICWFLYWIFPM